MSSSKDSTNTTDSASKKLFTKPRKWLLLTAAGLFMAVSVGFASQQFLNASATSYYNVYVKDELIGSISSQEELFNLYDRKKDEYAEKYPEVNMQLNTEAISLEKVRGDEPTITTEATLDKLDGMITAFAEGAELKVGGKVIGIVKDQKTADQILQRVKNNYITTDEKAETPNAPLKLKTVAAFASSDEKSAEPKEEQVTLASVSLKEEVAIEEVKADPNKILTDEEAIQLLTEGKEEKISYQVKEGDTLSSLSETYEMTLAEIRSLNPGLEDDNIQVGQKLILFALKPALTVTTVENVVEEVITEPQVEIRKSDELKSGVTKVVRPGQTGRKQVSYRITKENGDVVKEEWLGQEVLEASVTEVVLQGTKVTGEGSGVFSWPVTDAIMSSSFGQRWGRQHKGIDLVGERAIKASDEGVVTFAGQQSGYGNVIIINHGNGYETLYGHLNSINVKEGQIVEKGESIGVMGNTGRSTGTHLHFEIKKDSVALNPMKYLP
ncbi:M23 family metallopeptidase [Paenibacillus sp. Marseille-Q4541]|uniref:M23 family metallopeptidase n=1 Tax=Paenibacillus sp. Marseille-Q4541 TaxID=2831522 RepID=UPI001BA57365|nr:M23 family metallopeptidase [Paenibacillus sp. Marseille-Q4541]